MQRLTLIEIRIHTYTSTTRHTALVEIIGRMRWKQRDCYYTLIRIYVYQVLYYPLISVCISPSLAIKTSSVYVYIVGFFFCYLSTMILCCNHHLQDYNREWNLNNSFRTVLKINLIGRRVQCGSVYTIAIHILYEYGKSQSYGCTLWLYCWVKHARQICVHLFMNRDRLYVSWYSTVQKHH